MSVILVTHDLGVIAQTCDRVAVMYAGRVVETGTGRRDLFASRAMPTRWACWARCRGPASMRQPLRLDRGPAAAALPICRRAAPSRRAAASRSMPAAQARPPLVEVAPAHRSACIRHDVVAEAGER